MCFGFPLRHDEGDDGVGRDAPERGVIPALRNEPRVGDVVDVEPGREEGDVGRLAGDDRPRLRAGCAVRLAERDALPGGRVRPAVDELLPRPASASSRRRGSGSSLPGGPAPRRRSRRRRGGSIRTARVGASRCGPFSGLPTVFLGIGDADYCHKRNLDRKSEQNPNSQDLRAGATMSASVVCSRTPRICARSSSQTSRSPAAAPSYSSSSGRTPRTVAIGPSSSRMTSAIEISSAGRAS